MRKKILSGIIILAMTMSVCMVAVAAENPSATKSSLRSSGAIHYSQGENGVIIDSADLYTLADQLDLFKVRVVQQLGVMHTYLTKSEGGVPLTSADGIYAVHSRPSDGEEVDTLSLDFATILEGIAVSQSIPTDPAAYGMSSSTVLYKTPEGELTTTFSEDAKPVGIKEATADNLSAGKAAWVNGKLLLGTGKDVANAGAAQAPGTGGEGQLAKHDISSNYIAPEDITTAFAYVYNIGEGSNDAAVKPVCSVEGGGTCYRLYGQSFSRNGYNVKIALYYLKEIPQGAVVKGDNGQLFY